jgi:hypothetical protein
MFNALKYTKSLEENGFDRRQAEVLVGMYMQMLELNMVSRSEFQKFQAEMYNRFDQMDSKMEKLALQLTVKLGVMLAISVGLISTLIALKF